MRVAPLVQAMQFLDAGIRKIYFITRRFAT